MDYVVYNINVKNNSNSSILLDTLQENTTLRLIGNNDAAYRLSQLNLKESDLKINTSSSKNIKLTFNKQYGSQIKGKAIQLTKVVMDYTLYKENYKQYENFNYGFPFVYGAGQNSSLCGTGSICYRRRWAGWYVHLWNICSGWFQFKHYKKINLYSG